MREGGRPPLPRDDGRAATSLARLWQARGSGDEARDLLADILARFTEGFETRDLTDARALFEALGVTRAPQASTPG